MYIIKVYGGVGVELRVFLTSTLDGGKWWVSCPGHFAFQKIAPFKDSVYGKLGQSLKR